MSAPTDREMLALAAKAAGIGIEWHDYWEKFYTTDLCMNRDWNPLTSAGDRYHLAQTLGMNIDFADCFVWKRMPTGVIQEFWGADTAGDDDAHAIVRLAAVIGRTQ